jgi:hypothetical protein
VPDILERLEKRIRRHIVESMPAKAGYLEELDLGAILIEYRVWRARFIEPRPRRVHRSAELRKSPKAEQHAGALAAIKAKVSNGDDLNPHLSTLTKRPVGGPPNKAPGRRTDRDLLLGEWGIHHLHLSSDIDGNGFTARTSDVLFAVFRDSDAYLLGVFDHPQRENWAAEAIFAVLTRNWPRAALVTEINALRLAQGRTYEDRLRLRKAGVTSMLEVDGKVYSPSGIGLTTAGTPIEATRQANALMWELTAWRQDPYELLREADGVPSSAYWLPAIHIPVPGFEEYCGFATGSNFYEVGRLC